MRYLFMVIAVCLPTWGTAGSLNADTRYLCEAETTFGWREESEFTKPEVWVARTKYVIEAVPQQMEQKQIGGANEDVEVTHTVKRLGDVHELFCTTSIYDFDCFFNSDVNVLFSRASFVVRLDDSGYLNFFYENLWANAHYTMAFGESFGEVIAFEAGSCVSF